jgi:hypothetical protein
MKQLSPEQMARRRKLNKRILLISGSVILLILLIAIFAPNPDARAAGKPYSVDSLTKVISGDTYFKVTQISLKDSILSIAVSKTYRSVDSLQDAMAHFNMSLDLDLGDKDSVALSRGIDGLAIYKDSISNVSIIDSMGPHFLYTFYQRFASFMDKIGYHEDLAGECTMAEGAIKKKLNDPDSYSFDSGRLTHINDSTVSVYQRFRAKNGFGAIVLGEATVTFNTNGEIIDLEGPSVR